MKQGQFLKLGTSLAIQVCLPLMCYAQVNTGSNGSDGALDFSSINYTTNIVIDIHDHPNGLYQYTYVSIPGGVTVTFIPNANNSPVTWLVQSSVVINGAVDVSGQNGNGVQNVGNSAGGQGGPGGWSGGNGGDSLNSGQGPGGGQAGGGSWGFGANASYGTLGLTNDSSLPPGAIYGNSYLIPLLGGSGGGGGTAYSGVGGGGGGGAILVAASGGISLNGLIIAVGGSSGFGSGNNPHPAGAGSGGSVRLLAATISGSGQIRAAGGTGSGSVQGGWPGYGYGGSGRVRFDTYLNNFGGQINGVFTQGSQFIIIPTAGQGAQLAVTSVGGVPVSVSPTGTLSTPDAVLSAQQNNPIPIVVSCANLPLNTPITVSVKPANGSPVSAVGYNTTGTLASSTATISIIIPRGGGLIYATAATSN
jgi:hypothetical protein